MSSVLRQHISVTHTFYDEENDEGYELVLAGMMRTRNAVTWISSCGGVLAADTRWRLREAKRFG